MSKYRNHLPQLDGHIFLTDGGIETSLIFLDGFDLPYFAAFDLLKTEKGRKGLHNYYVPYAAMARDNGVGFVLESPTWRANADWAAKLGYDAAALAEVNRDAIRLMTEIRDAYETRQAPFVISGCIGPRGDGYDPGRKMSVDEAERYHGQQIAAFAGTEADMVTAITMNYVEEATGLARAAARAGMPAAISFTVETDGHLPTGQSLRQAIEAVDAATGGVPAYFMINCAHPTHFHDALAAGESWTRRVRGIRANASTRSHAELDAAPDLDAGNPVELGREYGEITRRLGHINVLGGCCGTDHRHVEQICHAVKKRQAA